MEITLSVVLHRDLLWEAVLSERNLVKRKERMHYKKAQDFLKCYYSYCWT